MHSLEVVVTRNEQAVRLAYARAILAERWREARDIRRANPDLFRVYAR